MCHKIRCGKCDGWRYDGCGMHITEIMLRIPKGQWCTCVKWDVVRRCRKCGKTHISDTEVVCYSEPEEEEDLL